MRGMGALRAAPQPHPHRICAEVRAPTAGRPVQAVRVEGVSGLYSCFWRLHTTRYVPVNLSW
jgi:hypothetical protein